MSLSWACVAVGDSTARTTARTLRAGAPCPCCGARPALRLLEQLRPASEQVDHLVRVRVRVRVRVGVGVKVRVRVRVMNKVGIIKAVSPVITICYLLQRP